MNEYAKYQLYISLFNSALSLALSLYAIWKSRSKEISTRFETIATELIDLKAKVTNPSNHCPGHGNLTGRCDANRDTSAEHKNLLTALESELKHLPKTGDLEKIYDRINEIGDEFSAIKADVARVSGAMPGITHLTQMMNQFLLTQGGKQ